MAQPSTLGRVVDWDDARGFGFIEAQLDPRQRLFFHIRDYRQAGRRPEAGELVRFDGERQADGRWRAQRVERVAHRRPGAVKRAVGRDVPATGWSHVLAVLVAYAALLAWSVHDGRLPRMAIAGIVALSMVTFAVYAFDKRAAQAGRRRVPEAQLHAWEVAGGWPGGLLAQRLLRHKSRKQSYRIVFWLMVLLNIALVLAWPELVR